MKKIIYVLLIVFVMVFENGFYVYSDDKSAAQTDDLNVAYAYFNAETARCKDVSVSIGPGNNINLYNKDGHSGWILNEGETSKSSRIDICLDDEFAFENTNGTSYTVEVDYLDDESGHFNLVYDAYNMTNKETTPTYIGTTGKWKTAVYELDDACFGNCMTKGADLRIATYDQTLTRASDANIVISAFRITKHNAKNPVRVLSVETEAAGNVFGNGEVQKFSASMINNTSETKNVCVTFEAIDSEDNVVWSNYSETMIEKSNTTDVSAVSNLNKYGLYNMRVTVRGDGFKYIKAVPFSLVNNRLDGKKHSLFGYNSEFSSNVPGYEYDYKKALELYDKVGISFIRTSMVWNKVDPNGKPKYTCEITEQYNDLFNEIAKHKLDVTLNIGLYGPSKYDGLLSTTHMPITEDAMKGYAEFCRFNARVCKERGINVLGHELWNESEQQHFNKNATMEQASEIAVNAAKAISEVDPDASKKSSASFCMRAAADTFAQGISADGYAEWCGALICHTYNNNTYPESQTCIETMQDYIDKYEEILGKKPEKALMTEYGRQGTYFIVRNPVDRACMLMRDSVFIQKSGIFDKLSWYTLTKRGRTDHAEDTYGDVESHNPAITEVPFAATETFAAKANYNNLMCEAEYERMLADDVNGKNAYLFKNPDDSIMTVWTADRTKKYDVFSFKSSANSVKVYDIYGNSEIVYSDEGIFTIPITGSIKYIEGNISDAVIPDSCYLFYEDFEKQLTGTPPVNVYAKGSYSLRESNKLTSDLVKISSETNGNKYLNIQDNADGLQNAVVYLNKPVNSGTVVLEFDGMIPRAGSGVLYSCHKAVKAEFTSNAERKDYAEVPIMVHEGKDGGGTKNNSVALYHNNPDVALGVRCDINFAAKASNNSEPVEFQLDKWLHYRVEVDLDNKTERVWVDGVISREQHNLKLETNKQLDAFNFSTTWVGRGAWYIDNIKVYKKDSLYTSPFEGEIINDFGTIKANLICDVSPDAMQLFDSDGAQQSGTFNVKNRKMTFTPDNKDNMIKNGVYYIKVQQHADGTMPIQKDRDFVYKPSGTKAEISVDNISFEKGAVIEPTIKLNHDDGTSGTIVIFAAAYKKRRLISISRKEYSYGENDLINESVSGLINVLPEDADMIKVFV